MTKSFLITESIKIMMIQEYKSYQVAPPKYACFAAKTDSFNLIIYNSLKVVISGSYIDNVVNKWMSFTNYNIYNIIGSDEVGTGDYFGPIVVCAVYVDETSIETLKNLNVADSKSLTDDRIQELANKLIHAIEYKIVCVDNKKYNELIDKGLNIKQILAIMHNKAISALDKECDVYIDQFCEKYLFERYINKKVEYNFQTKGETHYAAIAAASIIARAKFIKEMDKLNAIIKKEYLSNFNIVYGAGAKVDFYAKMLYDNIGREKMKLFVKIDFNNTNKIGD